MPAMTNIISQWHLISPLPMAASTTASPTTSVLLSTKSVCILQVSIEAQAKSLTVFTTEFLPSEISFFLSRQILYLLLQSTSPLTSTRLLSDNSWMISRNSKDNTTSSEDREQKRSRALFKKDTPRPKPRSMSTSARPCLPSSKLTLTFSSPSHLHQSATNPASPTNAQDLETSPTLASDLAVVN